MPNREEFLKKFGKPFRYTDIDNDEDDFSNIYEDEPDDEK